ncbi:hypothetical protein NC01_05690 [Streptococcus uberis]|nr:hypothetical protein NC01_05690 [Streptococcus uberis]
MVCFEVELLSKKLLRQHSILAIKISKREFFAQKRARSFVKHKSSPVEIKRGIDQYYCITMSA